MPRSSATGATGPPTKRGQSCRSFPTPPSGRLPLPQAGPVVGDLGLGGQQRTQLAFLLGDEDTDDLPADFRHAHPAGIGDALEPDQHRRGDVKLHGELTAGAVLGRRPGPYDNGSVESVLGSLGIPARPIDNSVTAQRAVGTAVRFVELVVAEKAHCANARPRRRLGRCTVVRRRDPTDGSRSAALSSASRAQSNPARSASSTTQTRLRMEHSYASGEAVAVDDPPMTEIEHVGGNLETGVVVDDCEIVSGGESTDQQVGHPDGPVSTLASQ